MEPKGESGSGSSTLSSSRKSNSSMSICINSSTSEGMEDRGGGRLEIGVNGMAVVEREGDEMSKTLPKGEAGQIWMGGGGGGRDGMTKERVFFWQKWKVGSSWALGPTTEGRSLSEGLDNRKGGKNDSGREDKLSSETVGGERVTKSRNSCVSHSASSPSSSDISSEVVIWVLRGRKSGIDFVKRTDNLFEFGAVTERDVGICSSSEVLGVSGN